MGRTVLINKLKLTTSNVEENNIVLQEISGQLYVNNHLVLTSNNIGESSNITSIESDITTLQSDVSTLQSESSEQESSFSNQYSVELDGTNDYVQVNSSATLGTISLWFKSDTEISKSSSPKAIVGFTGVGLYAAFASIQTGSVAGAVNDELITLYTGDRAYSYTSSSATINTNWHHLAIRWSGSDYEIYLDGVQVKNDDAYFGSVTPTPAKSEISISNFNIGRRNDNNRYFDGLIDEVAIWHTALSASDTAALYNSGAPGDLTSLNPNGWWRMGDNDSGAGTTITDQGSGSNDGELVNGPTFSSSTPS